MAGLTGLVPHKTHGVQQALTPRAQRLALQGQLLASGVAGIRRRRRGALAPVSGTADQEPQATDKTMRRRIASRLQTNRESRRSSTVSKYRSAMTWCHSTRVCPLYLVKMNVGLSGPPRVSFTLGERAKERLPLPRR